jgi:hypothetical protein
VDRPDSCAGSGLVRVGRLLTALARILVLIAVLIGDVRVCGTAGEGGKVSMSLCGSLR